MKYFHLKLKPTYFRYVANIWSTYAQNLLYQNCTIKICWLGKDLPWPKYGAVHKPNIIGPKLFALSCPYGQKLKIHIGNWTEAPSVISTLWYLPGFFMKMIALRVDDPESCWQVFRFLSQLFSFESLSNMYVSIFKG